MTIMVQHSYTGFAIVDGDTLEECKRRYIEAVAPRWSLGEAKAFVDEWIEGMDYVEVYYLVDPLPYGIF